MAEPSIEKQPCQQCGALILPATAEETGGLCMPCRKGRSPQDRSLGGLRTTPLQTILAGALIAGFGVLVYYLLFWAETSSKGIRVHWAVALAYGFGGKYGVAGIFVVIGVIVALTAFRKSKRSAA